MTGIMKSGGIPKLKMYYRWITNYLTGRLLRISDYAFSPRVLSIETTERCNLDCIMCPRSQAKLSSAEFTLEKFKRTLSVFPCINTVILLGRGETFMMKDIFPILDYGSGKGIHFTIITNGTLLNAETIKKIPRTGKLLVSIDHPQPEKYREIRRGGNLDNVISNLKELKRIRPDQWLCIQSVIMKDNIDFLEDFVGLAKSVSADAIKFIHPVVFNRAMEDIHIWSSADNRLKLQKAMKCAKKAGIRFVAVPSMKKPRICVEPWLGIRISLNGNIYPCCYIDNSDGVSWCEWYKGIEVKVPQSNYIMGNIHDESPDKIWNQNTFKLLRRAIRSTYRNTLMPDERLNELRRTIPASGRFSYCSVCLYRQNKAC